MSVYVQEHMRVRVCMYVYAISPCVCMSSTCVCLPGMCACTGAGVCMHAHAHMVVQMCTRVRDIHVRLVCVGIFVCAHVCACTCASLSVHACMQMHMCTYVNAGLSGHMGLVHICDCCLYVRMHVHRNEYSHVCAHAHSHVQASVHV